MIVTFYNKDFIALQNNSSLNVENTSWKIIKRAVDFDDFSLTSQAFVEDVNPTFVVMADNFGRYVYGAFAGVPQITKDNKMKLDASDLKTIFNNEILLTLGTYTTLKQFIQHVFNEFKIQNIQQSFNIELDLTDIENVFLDDVFIPETKLKVYNFWKDILVPYMKYYDCYMNSILDIKNKKIKFSIKRTNKHYLPLHLWEYDLKNYGKWVASVNEAQAVVSLNGSLTYDAKYILTSNNAITTDENNRDLYPIKKNIILKETDDSTKVNELLFEGRVEALKTLINNRYNESIKINANNIQSYEKADFDTSFNIYVEKGVLYKTLPLGEIQIDNKENKILKIGYKIDNIVYYI